MTAAFSMQFTAEAEVTHADGTTDSGAEDAITQED
jgi:hypothetical protein